MGELLTMSGKELERLEVLRRLEEGLIRPKEAAIQLGLGTRQLRNLRASLKRHGPKSLISKRRGKKSNHRYTDSFRENVLRLVREYYSDFGPTFAAEKLSKLHDLKIGVETLRQWMKESGIWVSRKAKKPVLHPLRARRKRFGELIQADGSHHPWFEDRANPCTLLVFIDDATSALTALKFRKGEDLDGYFETLEEHVNKYGLPCALYTDRFSVFKVCHGAKPEEHRTQFKRALDSLGIELICARSPQAKGRVERANGTLQDRLVKELRLRGISTIEEANLYLPEFVKEYNEKFKKLPVDFQDAHRPLREGLTLGHVLCRKETRKLTKDLTFHYANTSYKVLGIEEPRRAIGKRVEIYDTRTGMRVILEGEELSCKRCDEVREEVPEEMDRKELMVWEPRKQWIPPKEHPWRGMKRQSTSLRL